MEAVRVTNSGQAPGPKLVRLQLLLDPDEPARYKGTPLTDRHIRGRIQAGARGDEGALDWLESVLTEGILTEFAEVMRSAEASKADFHLTKWRDQADKASRSLPRTTRRSQGRRSGRRFLNCSAGLSARKEGAA